MLNEAWAAAAICCEPGCGWSRTHRSANNGELSITARNHAELLRHQTLMTWYAADRYLPDPGKASVASPRPVVAPPSASEPRARTEGASGPPVFTEDQHNSIRTDPI